MVSGLCTSPWDHERIFSGEARLIRTASKSVGSEPLSPKLGLMCSVAYLLRNTGQSSHAFQHRLRCRRRFEDRGYLRLQELDVETQGLELSNQHVERLGQASPARSAAPPA